MSLRLKILALASLLLSVFAATTALSAVLIRQVMEEMSGMVHYHIALTALVSEVDVLTYEYELNLRRHLHIARASASSHSIAAEQKAIGNRLQAIFKATHALLEKAVRDDANDLSDRIELARIDGLIEPLGRQAAPFVTLGDSVLKAIGERRFDEANRLAGGFSAFEQAFGADLSQIRKKITQLTHESLDETRAQSDRIRMINGVLFAVASVVGLGLFVLLTYRLHRAFRRLLDGTRQVEGGQLMVELPVTSRDEIGQLTRAFNQMIVELRGKERIKDTFGKFLDPRIVATLLGGQAENGHPAERRAVTIFFSDIKGFTAISEQLTADVVVRLLNAYFTAVTRIVRERNGIVDKYIGDSVMAFWSPPFSPGDQHAADACLAALAQQAAVVEFRREVSQLVGLRRNVPDFRVRMGLATGEVVVGAIGSDTVKSYTVIGDTVNVAARLESANKVYGTSVIVTEDTLRLAQQAVEAREIDLLIVAGKTEPVRIFELLCPAGELAPPMAELRGVFAEGLGAYRQAEWDAAEHHFRACLQLSPEDGPSRTFLERVTTLRSAPVPAGWKGVWEATAK